MKENFENQYTYKGIAELSSAASAERTKYRAIHMVQELDIFKKALVDAKELVLGSQNSVLNNRDNIQTQADILSQESIIATLKDNNISCKLYSEELDQPLLLGNGRYEIVLDPFDGSFLFLHGIRAFTSIAMTILQDREVKYAFVLSIANDVLYHCDAKNAYLNGQQIHCRETVETPHFITGYIAKNNMVDKAAVLKKLSSPFYFLGDGGPIHSAMVASNNIDAAIEFVPTSFHELAGAFIAEKAGAYIQTITGGPIVIDPSVKQTLITTRSEKLLRDLQQVLKE